MPTAKRLPSGSWRCQVFSHKEKYIDINGVEKEKNIYKSFTSKDKTKRGRIEVESIANDFLLSKQTNNQVISRITLKEGFDAYMKERKPVLSPSTYRGYKTIIRNNFKTLLNKNISDITQSDIQNEINALVISNSPKTIRNKHGLLTAVIKKYRPDFTPHTILPQKERPDLTIPLDEDIKILLHVVSEYEKDTDLKIAILLGAFCTMRRGEICGLDSEDINDNIIHVRNSLVKDEHNDWILKTTKTYTGDRFIECPDFVSEELKDKNGRIVNITPDVLTKRFESVLKKYHFKHFRFHDLRHYSASIQHALGVPDSYIMQRGGWKSDTVLKSVYRHTLDDKNKQMNEKINNHFETIYHTNITRK